MELRNKKLTHDEFMTERQQVLKTLGNRQGC